MWWKVLILFILALALIGVNSFWTLYVHPSLMVDDALNQFSSVPNQINSGQSAQESTANLRWQNETHQWFTLALPLIFIVVAFTLFWSDIVKLWKKLFS